MIDVLVVIALVTLSVLFLGRKVPSRKLVVACMAASALAHGACTAILYAQRPDFEYVVHPSPASEAGLRSGGTLTKLDGAPAGSLGTSLGAALHRSDLELSAGRDFRRRMPPAKRAFWDALDSYDLEEASGGLAFFPRKPVYKGYLPPLYQQLHTTWDQPLRIVSVHGAPTPTIGRFLAPMERVPGSGVIAVRYMSPGPDNGVDTFYYSPLAFEPEQATQRESAADLAQTQLGFSGVTLLTPTPRGRRTWTLFDLGVKRLYGPAMLEEMFRATPALRAQFLPDQKVLAWPRLALLPQIYESPFFTGLAGLPAPYLRQLLHLPGLGALARNAGQIPRQYYLLDDAFGAASLFHKLSSLAASLALALLAWLAFSRACPRSAQRRTLPVLALALVLQLADLFVLRLF